jgi:hypothetical protein
MQRKRPGSRHHAAQCPKPAAALPRKSSPLSPHHCPALPRLLNIPPFRDGVADMVRKGRDLERLVLARAVRWHLGDRVMVTPSGRTVVFQD